MTKKIRIENADTSEHQVVVYREYLMNRGTEEKPVWEWVREPSIDELNHPCQMLESWVCKNQRLVIEEK